MTETTHEEVRETVIDRKLKALMGEAVFRRLLLDDAIDENTKAVAALAVAGLEDAEALIAAMAMIKQGHLADVAKPLLDRLLALELIAVTVKL